MVVWRQGKEMTFDVTVGELTDDVEKAALSQRRGAGERGRDHRQVGPEAIRHHRRIAQEAPDPRRCRRRHRGGSRADRPAAEKDMRAGDVIAEVDQKAVTSPEDVSQRVKAAQDNGYRVVTLLVNRAGEFQWIALKITK